MKKPGKNVPFIPVTKNAAAPAQMPGQQPSLEQHIAEGHGRTRRQNADGVYLDSLIDLLYAEIAEREKRIQGLTAQLAKYESRKFPAGAG